MHLSSICSECGFAHTSVTCVDDAECVAWFDSQTEEFLAALSGYEDGLTPRKAWNQFYASSPAAETVAASSPAPDVAGQGESTIPQVYQDYMADRATLEEMLLNGSYKNCREESALCAGVVAITNLLRDRGVEA